MGENRAHVLARQAINNAVKRGRMPRPDALPCTDCKQSHEPGGPPHEYDHHLGYEGEAALQAEAVCRPCHKDRERRRIVACPQGHAFTEENTKRRTNGRRRCRTCDRAREKARPRRRRIGS